MLWVAFATVFVAELGDKTQLAALSLAASTRGRLSVFLGASLALVCTTGLAVLAADRIARVVPAMAVRRASSALFIVLGVWGLWSAHREARQGEPVAPASEAPPNEAPPRS